MVAYSIPMHGDMPCMEVGPPLTQIALLVLSFLAPGGVTPYGAAGGAALWGIT